MLARLKTKKGAALAVAAGTAAYAGLGYLLGFHAPDQALGLVKNALATLFLGG